MDELHAWIKNLLGFSEWKNMDENLRKVAY
jgi:hypothetical protein